VVQPATTALWFLPGVALLCAYIAWSDLARLKIPNWCVLAMVAVFAVTGLFALDLADYGWRWVQGLVMLVVGMALNAARAMGGGDSKFIAAAAPFVALGDIQPLVFTLAAASLAAVAVHRLAKYTPLRRLAPEWESWQSGKRFPMGVPLGFTLVIYLCFCIWPDLVPGR